jgi:predicted nucleic-acid-binding Zn-ribbon protein
MRNIRKCSKCGSESIIERALVMVSVEGYDKPVNLRIDSKPDALFFKGATRTPLEAYICGQCGFTEFYAADATQLAGASGVAKIRQSVLEST